MIGNIVWFLALALSRLLAAAFTHLATEKPNDDLADAIEQAGQDGKVVTLEPGETYQMGRRVTITVNGGTTPSEQRLSEIAEKHTRTLAEEINEERRQLSEDDN